MAHTTNPNRTHPSKNHTHRKTQDIHAPKRRGHSTFAVPLSALALLLVLLPGCRKQEPTFEIVTLEGKIDSIERTTDEVGEITVLYYSEKHKQEIAGSGLVTGETEIMINGAIGKLRDLREGDRVRGEVRIEEKSGEKHQIAMKIYVDRPMPVGNEGG